MKGIVLFLSMAVLFSCTRKQEIPATVLQPPQMQAVLWDMLRVDEFVTNYGRRDSSASLKDKSTRLYTEVFRIHNTTRSQFDQSIKFYNQHPDFFKIVLDSLEKKKSLLSEAPFVRPVDTLHHKIKPPRIHP